MIIVQQTRKREALVCPIPRLTGATNEVQEAFGFKKRTQARHRRALSAAPRKRLRRQAVAEFEEAEGQPILAQCRNQAQTELRTAGQVFATAQRLHDVFELGRELLQGLPFSTCHECRLETLR